MTVKISADYAGYASLPDEGMVEITYKLIGDESGPVTGTVEVDLSDSTSAVEEESISTRSSGTSVRATITDIGYNEWG